MNLTTRADLPTPDWPTTAILTSLEEPLMLVVSSLVRLLQLELLLLDKEFIIYEREADDAGLFDWLCAILRFLTTNMLVMSQMWVFYIDLMSLFRSKGTAVSQ
jgi:hypothetical protein